MSNKFVYKPLVYGVDENNNYLVDLIKCRTRLRELSWKGFANSSEAKQLRNLASYYEMCIKEVARKSFVDEFLDRPINDDDIIIEVSSDKLLNYNGKFQGYVTHDVVLLNDKSKESLRALSYGKNTIIPAIQISGESVGVEYNITAEHCNDSFIAMHYKDCNNEDYDALYQLTSNGLKSTSGGEHWLDVKKRHPDEIKTYGDLKNYYDNWNKNWALWATKNLNKRFKKDEPTL